MFSNTGSGYSTDLNGYTEGAEQRPIDEPQAMVQSNDGAPELEEHFTDKFENWNMPEGRSACERAIHSV